MTPPRTSSVGAARAGTALTPSMGSFSFGARPGTELEANKDELDEAKTQVAIANEYLEVKLVEVARDFKVELLTPVGVAPLSQLPSPPPGEMLLPGMKMMNGVAVRTSASHPMK